MHSAPRSTPGCLPPDSSTGPPHIYFCCFNKCRPVLPSNTQVPHTSGTCQEKQHPHLSVAELLKSVRQAPAEKSIGRANSNARPPHRGKPCILAFHATASQQVFGFPFRPCLASPPATSPPVRRQVSCSPPAPVSPVEPGSKKTGQPISSALRDPRAPSSVRG